MRALQRTASVAAMTILLLGITPAARAQVNGDATISAPGLVFGQPLTLSTQTRFGGSVTSIKWGGKEYINNWDHGRQLGLDSQFFNRYICYNPYETGTFNDGKGPTSTSKVLSLTASGNHLEANTQMAWYYTFHDSFNPLDLCGDPSQWLPCPAYKGPLSDYRVYKSITIGFQDIPNVIEYLVEQFVPEPVLKGNNYVVAVVNYDFSAMRSWDVVSKDYRIVNALAGVDDRVKVVSTPDGNYAMGWYAPELLQPYRDDAGVVNWWLRVPPTLSYPDPHDPSKPDMDYACVHFGSSNRYESFNGPGFTYDRAYLVVGNLDQVKDGLTRVHTKFAYLDPEIFNWGDYIAINNLGFLKTPEAAQNHWLSQGIAQGLTASKTFSAAQYLQLNPDVANVFGATNYRVAMDHFVITGRAEGRNTVVKPAAGMQHSLALKTRFVSAAGQNAFGQLGASTAPVPPTRISSLDNSVTEVAGGDYTSFAVRKDGTLWVWGSNQYGAHGDGTSGGNMATPVQVPIPARVTTPSRRGKHAVAVGLGVYAAIDTEGQVWTWGVNWNGRLGDGTNNPRFTPARVQRSSTPGDYLTGIVTISAAGGTVAAVDADGAVWTWGAGANGALGNGGVADSSYPVQVIQPYSNNATTPLLGAEQVACGSSGFCIALARNGTVYGWGNNNFSQLGFPAGGALSIANPIGISPQGHIDVIAAGSAHCIAHAQDGNVYGWGYNGRGQLGRGFTSVVESTPAPMSSGPDGMNDISDLAAGGNSSFMIRNSDRAVFVAGDNQSGQLGLAGNPLTQPTPVRSSF